MNNYSIIMCLYKNDKPNYFQEAIDSLLNQTVKSNDIVIVCDGPISKELNNIVIKYKKKYNSIISVIKLKVNQGLSVAINEGVKYCKNDIIARMDSDDISVEDRFEKQLNFLTKNNIDIVGGLIEEIQEDGKKTNLIRKVPETNEEIIKYSKYRSPFNHPTIMIKKQILTENNGYANIKLFEDYYFFIKNIKKYKSYNIQETLVYMRAGNSLYKRRGGINYAKKYLTFKKTLLKEHEINIFEYIISLFIRLPIILLPNFIRKNIYKFFLRKKKKISL